MSYPPNVQIVICLASGFGVEQYAESGVRSIYRGLLERYAGQFGAELEIHYDIYDGDWKGRAKRLHQVCVHGAKCIFLAHSWGWGRAAKEWAKQWRKLGRAVDLGVCIDGVPYEFLWLSKAIHAMSRRGTVHAYNMREVLAFQQTNVTPMGRQIDPDSSATVRQLAFGTEMGLRRYAPYAVGNDRIIDASVTHNSIDDDPRVHKLVYEVIDSKIKAWTEGR